MTKPKTKGQKALAVAIKAEQAQQKADLVDLFEAAPGEERAAKRRAMARRETVLAAAMKTPEGRREVVLAAMSPRRKNKHGNNVSYDQDGKWDSDAEKRRWPLLKALQKADKICCLKRQVRIPLHTVGGVLVGFYIADFTYRQCSKGEAINFSLHQHFADSPLTYTKDVVVEDVKGHRTDLFKWKQRHFKAEYGFAITEVKA